MGLKPGEAFAAVGTDEPRPCEALPPARRPDVFSAAIDDLTARWARGERAAAESYLGRDRRWPAERAVELVYCEYRLAATAGLAPSKSAYLARFPEHRGVLERLLDLDAACPDSFLDRLDEAVTGEDDPLPQVGDAIGPYVLERELGEGGFARVFLARQADLADRPVVVKITTRPTREPWLLARARHPNIVEVLTHAEVDDGDLQLIVMPFLGGAALSTVLARRRSRTGEGGASRFLADLDAVAATEHGVAGTAGPARAMLRGCRDPEAFAWIAARLAEALDHAWRRGVAHGDVKPSNILIAADGSPMLLDFNLAQDWSGEVAVDAGGTLVYMAPERLEALAVDDGRGGGDDDDDRAHRADVYALGMVLLEALTGWSPGGHDPGRFGDRAAFLAAARAMAEARRRPAWMIRRAEIEAGRALPAGLRAVLRHCLAADPRARYARGLELAEDLDRWRTDRPLAFAPEPSRLHVAARWIRRRRRPLATTTVGLLAVALVAWLAADGRSAQARLERAALARYNRIMDSPEAGALVGRRPGDDARRRPAEAGNEALRVLREYDLVNDPDWRTRDDFARLPSADRDDLELWLLEHALRYGRALCRRSDSPEDWRRGLEILDRAGGGAWSTPMLALRRRLVDRLVDRLGVADVVASPPARVAPLAVEAYLRGVSAEIDDEEVEADDDLGTRRAAGFYAEAQTLRPDSFWIRYRGAVAAFALSRWAEAADGLRICATMRPGNPVLHGVYASCLLKLGREDQALAQCDRGLELAPESAELVQVRAFIRAGGEDLNALHGDILRYERLLAAVPDRFLRDPEPGEVVSTVQTLPLGPRREDEAHPGIDAAVPIDEINARAVLASRILDPDSDGRLPARPNFDLIDDPRRLDLAALEVEKLLTLNPSNFQARVDRMCLTICRGRPAEARLDLAIILNDPRLDEYAQAAPSRLDALQYAACLFAFHKDFLSAHQLASKLVELCIEARKPYALPLYTLAAVEGFGAGHNARWLPVATRRLEQVVRHNPKYEQWFQNDPLFQRSRPQIQAGLDALRRPPGF